MHGAYLANLETEIEWGWGTPAGQERLRRRANLISKTAALTKDLRVLEIGCGTGVFTEIFAATGCTLTAVDLSPHLLAMAKQRIGNTHNVRFLLIPFEECREVGPFDSIIGSSVLHHMDLTKALNNIFALLQPDGKCVFAEPNHLNPQVFCERKFRRFFPYVSQDETAFYRWHLHRKLEASGFHEISILPFDWLHPATPASMIPFMSSFGRFLEKLPLMREFSGSLLISARKPIIS